MAEWAIAATYQVPGQSEVVMEFKKKSQEIGVGKETSLDDQRTDIKAASSSLGWERLISEADLASIGGRRSEPRQPVLDSTDRAKTYSPSSNSGGSSLAAFWIEWPFGIICLSGFRRYP